MATIGLHVLGMQLGGVGQLSLYKKMKLYRVRELKKMHKSFNILKDEIYRILTLGYLSLKYFSPLTVPLYYSFSFLFLQTQPAYANFLKSLVAVIVMLNN